MHDIMSETSSYLTQLDGMQKISKIELSVLKIESSFFKYYFDASLSSENIIHVG